MKNLNCYYCKTKMHFNKYYSLSYSCKSCKTTIGTKVYQIIYSRQQTEYGFKNYGIYGDGNKTIIFTKNDKSIISPYIEIDFDNFEQWVENTINKLMKLRAFV